MISSLMCLAVVSVSILTIIMVATNIITTITLLAPHLRLWRLALSGPSPISTNSNRCKVLVA